MSGQGAPRFSLYSAGCGELLCPLLLEIMDINDNAPVFRRETMHLDISESTAPGERFSLTNAVDADVGANSIKTYYLSESKYFTIEIQTGSDGSKYVDLVINSNLDREEQAVHHLILTAADGGVPARSSTASIILRVLDINDNAPYFNQSIYAINVTENSPIGTLVMKLNATDLDEGTNAEITYSYTLYTSEKTQEKFSLNSNTGEIKVKDGLVLQRTLFPHLKKYSRPELPLHVSMFWHCAPCRLSDRLTHFPMSYSFLLRGGTYSPGVVSVQLSAFY
uniref:Cadherin domain-containing protein n=1 Tax=Hucho hucho TaxID=62062 RepID=A0A4W5QK25_9TELE